MADFPKHPDPSKWDNYVDFESTSWPKKDRRRYWIIPSICFNCESACGILTYVDKDTLDVRKIEGNPVHPGSRGRFGGLVCELVGLAIAKHTFLPPGDAV